jgi:hypothetical protein
MHRQNAKIRSNVHTHPHATTHLAFLPFLAFCIDDALDQALPHGQAGLCDRFGAQLLYEPACKETLKNRYTPDHNAAHVGLARNVYIHRT